MAHQDARVCVLSFQISRGYAHHGLLHSLRGLLSENLEYLKSLAKSTGARNEVDMSIAAPVLILPFDPSHPLTESTHQVSSVAL